jgi:TolB protein
MHLNPWLQDVLALVLTVVAIQALVLVNGVGGGKDNLFTIQYDGSQERMVGLHPEDSYPHWSPSGASSVFYSTLQGDGRERIYIQWDAANRQEPAPLQINGQGIFGRYPTWLKNWRVAYTGCDYWASGGNCGVWTLESNGSGNPLQLTTNPSDISTDAHGNDVLFASQGSGNWELYVIPSNGGTARNLTNSPSQDVAGTYSPDGRHIAFISDRDGWGIWVMNADGGNPQKLLAVPAGFGNEWPIARISWGP